MSNHFNELSRLTTETLLLARSLCERCGLDPDNITDEKRRRFIEMADKKLKEREAS